MQRRYDRCPNCMQALQNGEDVCPFCNFEISQYEEMSNCLRPFTILQNKYMIGRVIGVGGFGITYIGWDLNLQTYIAIKEYFPESIASRDTSVALESTQVQSNDSKREVYDKGLKRYVEEAQNLSKFYQLQGIVSVKDFFYENSTGYIVMEYINGINLKEYLKNSGGKLDEATVLALMKPVLESLYQIHNAGMVHRDISPDNIMVDKDNKIKLIDFGSARGQSAESEKTYTVILKHGYAPPEQYYAKGNQGPWTDIYSLCATMYRMLTGQNPPNSVERMETDDYVNPSSYGVQVSPRTEEVLRRGLAVKVNDRYQNIGQMLADLYGNQPLTPMQPATPNATVAPGGASTAAPMQPVSPMQPVTPMNNATPIMGAGAMTQQSMHLNMQPAAPAAPASNKKKTTGIIVIAVVAVLLIVGLAFIIFGGKDDDKKDKDNKKTTEQTTEDGKTTEDPDEPTTEEPSANAWQWPTELSDNWRDYQLSIDGTIYAFPMPYSEFESMGWKCSYLPTHIDGGGSDYATFELDGIEAYVLINNYGLNEAPIEDCHVIGISVDSDDFDATSHEIIMPGGFKMLEATLDEVKASYGAPEYIYDGETYTSVDYAGDEWEDGMDLEFNAEGKLSVISMANTAVPADVTTSPSDISTEPPAVNAQYVAPSGPSTDRFDNIITIDGAYYQIPVPVSEFTANGWMLDTATDDYISGNSVCWTYLEKDGHRISVTIENWTSDAILPINGMITEITAEADYCGLEVVFPGGLSLGDPGSAFTDVYGDLGEDYSRDDSYSSFISYTAWYYGENYEGSWYIHMYTDPETDIIDEYMYQYTSYE